MSCLLRAGASAPGSQGEQFPRGRGEQFGGYRRPRAGANHQGVLDPDAAQPKQVESRLHCDHVAFAEGFLVRSTEARLLVHVETERTGEKLVNQRLAYVAVSRGQYDARIYTDDKAKLARALNREVSHRSALEGTPEQLSRQGANREISRNESIGHTMAVGSR